MPGKSRHGKGKHQSPAKRRKDRRPLATTAAPPATQVPVAIPAGRVSPPSVPPPPAKPPATARYPYMSAELLRIGILTGVILAILLTLAFILPKL